MAAPLDITVRKVLEDLREQKYIPLGIIAFDMNQEKLSISLFRGVDVEEANALLEKVGLKGKF